MAAKKRAANAKKGAPAKKQAGAPFDVAVALAKKLGVSAQAGVNLRPTRLMPTGLPLLDLALNGGIGYGRITQIWGDSAAGKTAMGLHLAAMFQRVEPSGIVLYADTERALAAGFADLLNVDMSRVVVVEPESVEEAMAFFEQFLRGLGKTPVPVLIVWDSIAATAAKAELEGDYDSQQPALLARALSRGLKKLRPVVTASDALVVVLNQNRESLKAGTFVADSKKPCGGRAVEFYSDLTVRLARVKTLADKGCDPYGMIVEARVTKSRQGPPFRKARFHFFYETGVITDVLELYATLKRYNLAESVGGGKVAVKLPPEDGKRKWRRIEYPSTDALGSGLVNDPDLYAEVMRQLQQQMYSATPDSVHRQIIGAASPEQPPPPAADTRREDDIDAFGD